MTVMVRTARQDEAAVLIGHYRELCATYDVPPSALRDDWVEIIEQFFTEGAKHRAQTAFVAEEAADPGGHAVGAVVGSILTQIQTLPYPDVLKPSFRKSGHIWSLYVVPGRRGRGIAATLLRAALADLRATGCTRCVLHASERARPLYMRAGFVSSTEMRIDLV